MSSLKMVTGFLVDICIRSLKLRIQMSAEDDHSNKENIFGLQWPYQNVAKDDHSIQLRKSL